MYNKNKTITDLGYYKNGITNVLSLHDRCCHERKRSDKTSVMSRQSCSEAINMSGCAGNINTKHQKNEMGGMSSRKESAVVDSTEQKMDAADNAYKGLNDEEQNSVKEKMDVIKKTYRELRRKYRRGNRKIYTNKFTAEQIMYQMKELMDYIFEEAENRINNLKNEPWCGSIGDENEEAQNNESGQSSTGEESSNEQSVNNSGINIYRTSLETLRELDADVKTEFDLDEEVESDYGREL